MSTPQLPNLLDSLGTGRGRGRRRGRGRDGLAENHEDNKEKKDRIVQKTDEDASVSRMSAVELGYLDDPFARAFIYDPPISRRYPIINRGTYVRTAAIDTLVNKFLATNPSEQKQIISLGAGSDTRYFRIIYKDPAIKLVYHELDFPANTAQKISAIQRTPSLLAAIRSTLSSLSDLHTTTDTLTSPSYNIHPLDLRTLASDPSTTPSPPLPTLPHLSSTAPTLLLSECCLIYLSPTDADAILHTLTTRLILPTTPSP
ncbi:carboxy methyl transferase for protein phosphatase 2A [Coniosporium tulheliwenetii]|uniref:Carboxy methyl transferase for protein phosphatase 2A n=1 Tax=Coniosporium tulheliwenetii TaxID=3383036 RepID=A0ACC2ZN08_9PEZI|nr:carboxy methyl transferase for protein phosphatase 2A [Cladosporium sp. JES 115]